MITIEEIKELLPHRYPFLLIDRVLELEENRIKALKNVTVNEDFFNGHFPGTPIMPAVLQMEAVAQAGCLLICKQKLDDPSKYINVFTSIKNARFKKPVVPGDQLILEVEISDFRRGFAMMKGSASVDGKVVSSMEASAAVVPKEKL